MTRIDTSKATPTRDVRAIVRVGTGSKLHPALVTKWETEPGAPWNRTGYTIQQLVCRCPNACNGQARHSASVVAVGSYDGRTCGK